MNLDLIIQLSILFASGIIGAKIFSFIILFLIKKLIKADLTRWLDISKIPLFLLLFCLGWFIGLQFINAKPELEVFLVQPIKWIIGYGIILFLYHVLDLLEFYIKKAFTTRERDSLHKHLIPYSKRILKIIIIIVAVLIILQNSGINVTSLLASLGIGGLALAFGAKETLSHLFGGITVIIDKPFVVGDWIVCDKIEGTIEDIGFRSTKLKTFYDSVVTVPNAIIANSTIDNLGRRKARRTRFTLDVTYDTSPEEIEAFLEGIKNIILSNKLTKKDYYQVYFSGYASSSLQILVNFFLQVNNWNEELLEKQNIFLEILRLSQKLNISFAFPTQTLDIPYLPEKSQTPKQNLSQQELKERAKSFAPEESFSKPQGLGIFKPPFKK